jgi:aerobic-type carbon monoxide dehydrogenase small subunit (CoxS/CutS family)
MGDVRIELLVNGTRHRVDTAPNRTLVDILREDLRLTGTKEACSIGVCGVCTVLLDGRMISACLVLAQMVDGAEVTTIEGIGSEDNLSPVQQAFIDFGGFQCGICTPGQIVAATALLDEIPAPTAAQVKAWMTGNLCRCTGYYTIVDSILGAARARAAQA